MARLIPGYYETDTRLVPGHYETVVVAAAGGDLLLTNRSIANFQGSRTMIVTAGKTNVTVYYYIVQDASNTSPGEPVTGLLFSDIETGGSASYARQGAARVDLTLITLASASATHADGGFILVDDTNMPGLYRCDYPDLAFATGIDQVFLSIVVASGKNAVAAPIIVEISDVDLRESNGRVDVGAWLGTAVTTSSTTNKPEVDINSISDDATAADNLEATYDGTGYTDDDAPAKQSQVSSLANVGSATHKPASSYVLTTGTQSANTVSETEALDGVRHEHTDTAGVLELYYEFLIGSGTPSSAQITGYVTGNNDDVDIFGFDWVSSSFKQIGNIQGTNSATNAVHSFDLFVDMVGSGSDLGKVRVQFKKASGLTTAVLAVDQIFVAFSQGSEGYDNGAIWADSKDANTNTVVGIDGVSRNPVSTVGAINTLLASTNLHRIEVAPDSTFTFAAAQTDESWRGDQWTLALGGQDIAGSVFSGAMVSGVSAGTGTTQRFTDCVIGDSSHIKGLVVTRSGLEGVLTLLDVGDYFFHQCFMATPAGAIPVIDFGASLGSSVVHLHDWRGRIEVRNFGQNGSDEIHLDGQGLITFTASCVGGTIFLRGSFELVNSGSGITINDDARYDQAQILEAITSDDVKFKGADIADTLADTNELQTDWKNTGRLDVILDARMAETSISTTGGAVDTVTAVTDRVTANTDQIAGDATAATNLSKSTIAIEPGAAVTGTLSTTEMTTDLTEVTDDHYIGRIIIWTSGVLKNQATDITDYTGSNKKLTYTATTEAPSNTDTFVII